MNIAVAIFLAFTLFPWLAWGWKGLFLWLSAWFWIYLIVKFIFF